MSCPKCGSSSYGYISSGVDPMHAARHASREMLSTKLPAGYVIALGVMGFVKVSEWVYEKTRDKWKCKDCKNTWR